VLRAANALIAINALQRTKRVLSDLHERETIRISA
jgi:hypothetical protein